MEDIAAGRGISENAVKSLINKGPYVPDDALELGLVDRLAYWDEVPDIVEEVSLRKHKRIDTTILTQITKIMCGKNYDMITECDIKGNILDISIGGCLITVTSNQNFDIDNRIYINFNLPQSSETINLLCHVRRIQKASDHMLLGIQFIDMTEPYSLNYQNIAKETAKEINIDLKEGVYLATMGPTYDTRSEIKMFRYFGADAVGMSTIFETIACNFLNMKVLAFCCITNPAADRHEGNMNHEEVLEALRNSGDKLSNLTTSCAKKILKK